MTDDFTKAGAAAQFLMSQTSVRPKIGLVLGSGLGGFLDELSDAMRIPFTNIPFFPRSTAMRHAAQMVIGMAASVAVAVEDARVGGIKRRPAAEPRFIHGGCCLQQFWPSSSLYVHT